MILPDSEQDKMLAAMGLGEGSVHITNIVYWRPPGNRTPTAQEALACRPFLERQLELVEPDIVLLFGGAAAKHILDTPDGIMRIRGKWRDMQIGSRTVKVMATLHPAYLLRTPAAKRLASSAKAPSRNLPRSVPSSRTSPWMPSR